MATLAGAFEEEVRRKVGHVHHLVADPGREPTYGDFVGMFPATAAGRVEAARAAGYGGPRDHRPNTRAWTRRRSFMRQLQRWQTSALERRRPPHVLNKREAGIVRARWKKDARPGSARAVLRVMWRYGVTVTALHVTFTYEDDRPRELDHYAVGIRPGVLRRSGFTRALVEGSPIPWTELADAFLLTFGRAYGMGDYAGGGASEAEEVSFRLGFTDQAVYAFGTSSRPPGEPRATGKRKYRGIA